MTYNGDWIKKNMGITRKTLLVYEEKGLITPARNPNNEYREYSEEDLQRIWMIKMLRELRYSMAEIIEMGGKEDFTIRDSIEKKLEELEKQKTKIEQLIGLAKMIKLTGRIPNIKPEKMGSMKFEEFLKFSFENWNINEDQEAERWALVSENILHKAMDDWTEEDIKMMETAMEGIDVEAVLKLKSYCDLLGKMKDLGVSHQQVQGMVHVIYHYYCEHFFDERCGNITPQRFADFIGNSFLDGAAGMMNENIFGKDICEFIAEAIEYFSKHVKVQSDM